jgi:hypothetical protein
MKLDKRHMYASIVMLVCAVSYNVWVFTRPAGGVVDTLNAPVAPLDTPRSATTAAAADGPIDPAAVAAPADVALDRLPGWPRNPFASLRAAPPPEIVETDSGPVAVDPDPVVATILYSAERRRAVIDGRIVGVGDRVGRATVVEILPAAVVLDSPERGRLTLALRAPGGVRR